MPQPNPSGRGPSRRESVLKPPAEAPRATTSKSPPERCRGSVILPAVISDAGRIGDSGTFSPYLAYLKGADVSSNLPLGLPSLGSRAAWQLRGRRAARRKGGRGRVYLKAHAVKVESVAAKAAHGGLAQVAPEVIVGDVARRR